MAGRSCLPLSVETKKAITEPSARQQMVLVLDLFQDAEDATAAAAAATTATTTEVKMAPSPGHSRTPTDDWDGA